VRRLLVSELTEPQLRALNGAVETLRFYSRARIYGSGEHSIFIDDSHRAKRALGGLLDSGLVDLTGEVAPEREELLADRGREVLDA
jgi:hypothetical protein